MAITLFDGVTVPDIPQSVLTNYPYIAITYALDLVNSDISSDNPKPKYKYLLHGVTKPFKYVTESSGSILMSDSDIYVEYALDTINNIWAAVPNDEQLGQIKQVVDNDYAIMIIASVVEGDMGMVINIASLRYMNHDIYYAVLNQDSSGTTFDEVFLTLETKIDFNLLTKYNNVLLPQIPKEDGYTKAIIIQIQQQSLIGAYMCILLPEDVEIGAWYSNELFQEVPVVTLVTSQTNNTKLYILGDIYSSWTLYEEEIMTSLPLINMDGMSIELIYSNQDIPYVIFYGDNNIYNTDSMFYSVENNEILPDIENSSTYYAVPSSFLKSMARGVRRLSGSNERMDCATMSETLTNSADYFKIFNKTISSIDWELPISIPAGGFAFCSQLKKIDSENVECVGPYSFTLNSNLSEINLPNLKHIGDSAFSLDTALTSISFPQIISIGNNAFSECNTLTKANIENVEYLGAYSFDNTGIEEINLPKVKIIPDSCFRSCNLTSIDLPLVTSIGTYAFGNNNTLTTVNLPLCTSIAQDGFYYCTKLTDINLPLCKTIDNYAFYQCSSLEVLDLPSVTYIGNKSNSNYNYVFTYCNKLKALILRSPTMCELNTNTNVFTNTPITSGSGYIYVPSALLQTYKANAKWSSYSSKFRALENYTVDGTITGAIDKTKI